MTERFNRLTVIEDAGHNRHGGKLWLCQCDCGTVKIIGKGSVISGSTKSCGCWQRERGAMMLHKHGFHKSRTYRIWIGMRQRCKNPNNIKFPIYGGRGITVCDRWENFESFIEDMGPAPDDKSLDRINGDGDYRPENCRWASSKEQRRNSKQNRMITRGSETLPLCVWVERANLPYPLVWGRLSRGWSVERALTTPTIMCKDTAP